MNITVKLTHLEIVELIKKHLREELGEGVIIPQNAFDVVDEHGVSCFGFTVSVDVTMEKPKPISPGQSWRLLAEVPIPGAERGAGSWASDDPYHWLSPEIAPLVVKEEKPYHGRVAPRKPKPPAMQTIQKGGV